METEDQQVERLKEFWNEHGKGLVAGAIIGFGLFYGWRYYDASVTEAKEAASERFNEVTAQFDSNEAGDKAVAIENAQAFINEKGDTTYAHLTALQLAKEAVSNGDLATAVSALQQVRDNAEPELRAIADIRQARVLLAQQQYDAALAALATQKPASFTAVVAELRGDVLVETGDIEGARAAYQLAVDEDTAASMAGNSTAKLKLQNLAVAS